MPIGVLINSASTLCGGLLGCLLSRVIPKRFQEELPVLFGYCAMAIGVNSIVKVQNMAAVVMAVILGYCAGSLLHLEDRARGILQRVTARLFRRGGSGESDQGTMDYELFTTVAALFCFSGFGWYGTLIESLAGDSSILISKSVLDFFTAFLFSVILGREICILPFFQAAVLMMVFLAGKLLGNFIPQTALANLSAVGGILTLATGFRVAKIKSVPIFNMVPALVLVFLILMLF